MLRALLIRGLFLVFYADNGKVYKAKQLAFALDRVNARLVHSRAYYSEGRGAIERFWQAALDFEAEVRAREELLTLHELNVFWEAWLSERYLHAVHSALGRTPAEAIAQVERRALDPEVARALFRVKETRQVHRKDGCISVEGRRFQCGSFLRGQQVEVTFDPNELSSVEVGKDGRRVQTAFPQKDNEKPEPPPEPEQVAQSVDYLQLLREDYDRRLLEHARPLAYADLSVVESFDEAAFVELVAELAGIALRASSRRELSHFWRTFQPLPEDLVRIPLEHAVRLQGRGRHAQVYLHAIRVLVLAHWRQPPQENEP